MQRYQLEHALRAAREITGESEFIVVGSSALLGPYPDAPAELTASLEVDLYPRLNPASAEKLNAIGELSPFHQTHGFWIDPVGPETATVPTGWETRLIPVRNANTNQATGWCLEVHDLAISKLVAGREKDLEYIRCLLRHRLVQAATLEGRFRATTLPPEQTVLTNARLGRLLKLN